MKNIIDLSTINFCPGQGGGEGGNIEPSKTVYIDLLTDIATINPDEGFDGMAQVIVEHDKVEEVTAASVSSNGTVIIEPSAGYGATLGVELTVDVHPTTKLEASYDSNGVKELTGEWKDAKITIDVPEQKPEEVFNAYPTTVDQTITPSEGKVFSSGTVHAVTADIDSNIAAGNIKKDVTILGVTGTLEEVKPEETFEVTPTNLDQTITPSEGKVFSSGVVKGYNVDGLYGQTEAILGAVTPKKDYRYMTGTVDREGLKAIGWTDEDILTYEANTPHYTSSNSEYIVSDENKAVYQLDNPQPAEFYKNDPNITFLFDKCINRDGVHNFQNMPYIKGLPYFDIIHHPSMSQLSSMSSFFVNCTSLKTIPPLDFSTKTDGYEAFKNCVNLTHLPRLNFSSMRRMAYMFEGCLSLNNFPDIDFSSATDVRAMFRQCKSLTYVPYLDLPNVIYLGGSDSTNGFLAGCEALLRIEGLNIPEVTEIRNAFSYCPVLKYIGEINCPKVTSFYYIFNSTYANLETVNGIDFSGATSISNLFGYTAYVEKLTRFIIKGKINVSIYDNYSIKAMKAIDYESIKSILEAANRTDNTNSKTLAFDRTVSDPNGELAALVASCGTKGWTITGLTLTA